MDAYARCLRREDQEALRNFEGREWDAGCRLEVFRSSFSRRQSCGSGKRVWLGTQIESRRSGLLRQLADGPIVIPAVIGGADPAYRDLGNGRTCPAEAAANI